MSENSTGVERIGDRARVVANLLSALGSEVKDAALLASADALTGPRTRFSPPTGPTSMRRGTGECAVRCSNA